MAGDDFTDNSGLNDDMGMTPEQVERAERSAFRKLTGQADEPDEGHAQGRKEGRARDRDDLRALADDDDDAADGLGLDDDQLIDDEDPEDRRSNSDGEDEHTRRHRDRVSSFLNRSGAGKVLGERLRPLLDGLDPDELAELSDTMHQRFAATDRLGNENRQLKAEIEKLRAKRRGTGGDDDEDLERLPRATRQRVERLREAGLDDMAEELIAEALDGEHDGGAERTRQTDPEKLREGLREHFRALFEQHSDGYPQLTERDGQHALLDEMGRIRADEGDHLSERQLVKRAAQVLWGPPQTTTRNARQSNPSYAQHRDGQPHAGGRGRRNESHAPGSGSDGQANIANLHKLAFRALSSGKPPESVAASIRSRRTNDRD